MAERLWKIQLVHNTTIQKSIQMTPLRALIGIESSTPLIRAAQNDLACDLSPVQNLQANQERVKGGLTPRQQLATCCLQQFLIMTGNITKKCCRQHVANCCLGVRPPLETSCRTPRVLKSTI
jgi:hypothetical protein